MPCSGSFVSLELFDEDQAVGTLTWPHSGFHSHTASGFPEMTGPLPLGAPGTAPATRSCWNGFTDDRTAKAVTYLSHTADDPTAGTETADPVQSLARVLVRIPETGHVTTRLYGWYANRHRGMRDKAAPALGDEPPAIVLAPRLAPSEASRHRAALRQHIFEVAPLRSMKYRGPRWILACTTQSSVIDQILARLRAVHERVCRAHGVDRRSRAAPPFRRSRLPRSTRPAPGWLPLSCGTTITINTAGFSSSRPMIDTRHGTSRCARSGMSSIRPRAGPTGNAGTAIPETGRARRRCISMTHDPRPRTS